MTQRVILSRQAWRDLEAIEDYTIDKWGTAQAKIYLRAINKAFDLLAINPGLGRQGNGDFRHYRLYAVEQHWIVYQQQNGSLEVLNLLHTSMDIEARLKKIMPKKPKRR